jgi:predicted nucleotidyltransferase
MYLTSHIPQIKKLCEQHKVEKLYAFGSVLTDRFNDDSDIDLSVIFKEMPLLERGDNYFDFKFSLIDDVFKRPVDLIEEKALENPYFIKELNETKQLIYG